MSQEWVHTSTDLICIAIRYPLRIFLENSLHSLALATEIRFENGQGIRNVAIFADQTHASLVIGRMDLFVFARQSLGYQRKDYGLQSYLKPTRFNELQSSIILRVKKRDNIPGTNLLV